MKKIGLFCTVFILSSLCLLAIDIKTIDGKVYKDVKITNVLPDAVDFAYKGKEGYYILRGVKLEKLTKELQKKFNYSPEKAKKFEKQVAQFQAERNKLLKKQQKEDAALFNKQKKIAKKLEHIKALLYAHQVKCWVHIIRPVGTSDCIAKVSTTRSTTKYGNLGHMYIRNLTGPQNIRIHSVIYPTGKSKSFQDGIFPVYDADLNKYALEILQKQEK